MINEFWESSGPRYRIVVFTAMGLIAVGIILTIVGAIAGNRAVQVTGLPVIGLGLIGHVVGLVIRGQEVRRRLRDRQPKR